MPVRLPTAPELVARRSPPQQTGFSGESSFENDDPIARATKWLMDKAMETFKKITEEAEKKALEAVKKGDPGAVK